MSDHASALQGLADAVSRRRADLTEHALQTCIRLGFHVDHLEHTPSKGLVEVVGAYGKRLATVQEQWDADWTKWSIGLTYSPEVSAALDKQTQSHAGKASGGADSES